MEQFLAEIARLERRIKELEKFVTTRFLGADPTQVFQPYAYPVANVAEAAIGSAQIADASVTTAKIIDLAVTNAKINSLDAGKITTGTLASIAISAVTITSSTITGSSLTLNLNSYTTTINNTAAALGTVGLKLQSNTGGQNAVLGGTSDPAIFFAMYGDSAQTKLSGSFVQSVNGSDRSGTIRLADGSGSGALGSGQRIILTGSDGKVQMGTLEVDRSNASVDPNFKNMKSATAGAVVEYLNVLVDGVARRIPCHAV